MLITKLMRFKGKVMAKVKVSRSLKTESRLKTALYYAIELLVDVLIIYAFVKAFSISFSFGYDVFHDSAKNPGDRKYVMVTIEPYSSNGKICDALYDAGVIENKYVMMARIKIGGIYDKIKPGSYGLSASMTYEEILGVITGNASVDAEDSSGTGGTILDEATPSDALDPNKIHDNSSLGAGEGANEGGEGTDDGFEQFEGGESGEAPEDQSGDSDYGDE